MNIPVEFVSELNSPDHSVVVAKSVGDGDDPSPAAVSHSAPQSLYSSATVDRGVHRLKFNCQCTEKCRFMDKRVREISRFFVAPPRVFPLSVLAARNHTRTHKFTPLSRTYP